ncbi:hypothetical protein BIV60_00040 [Bacillus sp. MUM 116]|uniref:DUF1835 domain-containing protein n=1 Tax=Bacillus sp. MUM 116 TaxID=1678002 RepID=UPI0008F5EAEB|nr:DUF1835 domain-containing protein [Bacillus sp. MUM 116]OIK17246.1 hypothetical protein BIV60_00040 [Bacillus sp. MUM 116]
MDVVVIKENYPFIYFFNEPHIVFVYKILTDDYVTMSELSECGEWETYELNRPVEFEAFNHETCTPLVERGYSIQQDPLNIMVGKINELIQKQRKLQQSIQSGSIHLVSSESTAGALRVGLDRPRKVISFQGFFSIGPVWNLDCQKGQDHRFEWLNENINFEMDDYVLENNFNKTLLEIEDIQREVPIYLWTANNADEQTGLWFILYLLRNKENDIILINAVDHFQGEEQSVTHSAWLHPDQLSVLFNENKMAKPLSCDERLHYQIEWEQLAQSKEVLRVWENGRIVSVAEDYYDDIIINTIEELHSKHETKDFIRPGMIIAEIYGKLDGVISDSFLEYRIRHLIYNGTLELKGIPKSMRHYRVKLRN